MTKIKNITKKNKKVLIIESSSSSSKKSSETVKNKKNKVVTKKQKKILKPHNNNKNKNTKKKRKLLIIESSSSDLPKDKIDSFFSEKTGVKIDLKPTQEVKEMNVTGRLNEQFIELMEKLADIMLKQGETFRARAYQKAQETIMSYPDDIMSPDDLKGKPNIGATIMEKLNEYVKTGTLNILEREKNNPVNILGEIYGIGPKKAKELVDKGVTTISQLKEKQDILLNDIQKVGLKYHEDILKIIPRSEVEQYKTIFTNNFTQIATPNSHFEIVGSYRRGAQNSGDIDVIITSDNASVFTKFIDLLIKQKVIIEVLSRGPTKCLVIAKIPSSDSARRVDFLYTSQNEYPFSLLYFTGSKIFNTVMRSYAVQKGFTMNEHGLYYFKDKKKGNKVDHKFVTEKDIFDYLGLEYKSPTERIDGRAVVIKNQVPIIEEKKPDEKKSEEKKILKPKKKIIIEEDNNENISKDSIIKNLINDFKKNGIKVLEQLNEKQLSDILREANKSYYNEDPLMTDNEYDIVKEYIEEKYPSNIAITEIGAPIEKNKVTLPYPMGSMNKIKPDTDALSNWINKFKGPYVLSCKLDGVSGLYTTEGNEAKLYTRGDGKVGQDISHLIPYLRLPKKKGIVIRGEFIIPKIVFESKYKEKFANPRNMVSGIINHKTINESIKDINFVAYEVIKPILKPSEQMALLGSLDVERVLYTTVNTIANVFLSSILVEWRKTYTYEIDGVIVANDAVYERKFGNPDHAFAFKMVLSDQIAEAKVVDVIWNASKDGYLKPRVQIEPIHLGGVKIEYATGFNAAFIENNKVGIGAIIELIRSGDVIPHIRKVTVPAEQSKMPSVPYKWNDTHVDIMLEDLESDETVKEKVITGFFRGLGVEGLSSGNVSRIIQAGFDTVPKILNMSINDFLTVDGFKEKTATKLYNGIREKIDSVSLITIMSASNIFGRGFSEKRLELIMDSYPDVLISKETLEQKIKRVAEIKGMAEKTAMAFVERIPDFIQFLKEAGVINKLSSIKKNAYDEGNPLFGKTIVLTGFRDTFIQDALKNIGAKLGSSVSKNTFLVLVKDINDDTGKVLEAKKLDIPLMTPEEFKEKYL